MGKKTDEQFKKEVYALYGDEYTLLDKYISAKTKVRTIHKKCGEIYLATPHHFLRGHGCIHCSGKNKKTTEQFCKEIQQLVGDEYKVLGEYTNATTKIDFIHQICGEKFNTKPTHFLRGSRCPKCARNAEKTTDSYKEEVFALVENEYSVLSEYVNAKTKVTLLHKTCGKEFKMRPVNFLRGDRCPHCFDSKGELAIKKYLDSNGIHYEREYKFDDCLYKTKLRFDFCIFLNSKEVPFLLLEYNGAQHYKPVKLFGGHKAFEEQKKRDQIKRDYCAYKKIPLLTIKYSDFVNIENVLEEKLNKYDFQKNTEVMGND